MVGGPSVRSLSVSFDGSGSSPAAGTLYRMYVPAPCTIQSATMVSDVSGSAVVDIWVASYPTIPTIANTIVASDKPTLSSAQASQDASLTGWTVTIPGNSNVFFHLDSASTLTIFTLTLVVVG